MRKPRKLRKPESQDEPVQYQPEIVFKPRNRSQKQAMSVIDRNEITFLTGIAGTAKAQPLSCKIATPSGFVTMGSISVGDDICTPDGGVSKVAGVFPQGVKDVYRITFSDGSSTRCCGDHLWKISKQSIEGEFVVNTSRLIEMYKTTPSEKDSNGRRVCNIPITLPVQTKKRDYFIHPYILGCLIGDGCFRGARIGFASADPFIAEEINMLLHDKYAMNHYGGIEYSIKRKTRDGNSPNEYIQELRRLGLWGKLSIEKHVPHEYLWGSVEDRIELLRGLMDTDGSASKCSTTFGTSSPQLARDVGQLVQSLGGTVTTSVSKTTHADAYKLTIILPNEINPFKLPRKVDNVHQREKYFPRRLIESIEPDGQEECQCIFINDGKHLYLTDEFIVTHNTFCAVAYALDAIYNKRLDYRHIVIVRPLVDADEDPGALPGTLEEKAEPYLRPITDALGKLTDFDSRLLKPALDKVVQVRTLGTMRGLTFDNSICILDEAQNATKSQLKMFLTRLGENSKMIVAGDCDQSDIEYSVLEKVSRVLAKNTGIGWFEFSPEDNCRNPLNKVVLDGMKDI